MPLCSCDAQLKATFFCFVEPKCNGGQVYYCADCCDAHEHKAVVISKKIREVEKQWNELISEILEVERQATYRYNSYKELINYCDEVNKQLPKAKQISQEGNLFADYTELLELKQWAQEQKTKVNALIINFKVVELLEMEDTMKDLRKGVERLQYLKDLSEIDIQKCYEPCFLKDIFYKFDDFPEACFRMLVNLKLTALSTSLR